MNEQFGKETDFEFKARLDEEIIPSATDFAQTKITS